MNDVDLTRLQRDVDDLEARMRTVESVNTPYQRQLVGELRDLQKRVEKMDLQGSAFVHQNLATVDFKVNELRLQIAKLTSEALVKLEAELDAKASQKALDEIVGDRKTDKSQVRVALIAAALSAVASLVVGIIVWALTAGPR